jgi:pilus assembly protein CpaD
MTHMSRPTRPLALIGAAALLAVGLTGCESFDKGNDHHAGWSLIEPSQRHPILVSQKPHNMNLRVARGQHGLSSSQRADLYAFLTKYKNEGGTSSRVVLSVPAGSANEMSAMHAVADMRPMLAEMGFSDASMTIEPYHAEGDPQPPIRVSYLVHKAEAPECGRWPDNVAMSNRNLNYANFGCAQQRNLANQIANPADLIAPRAMTARSGERNDVVHEKYIKGSATGATRSEDERASR